MSNSKSLNTSLLEIMISSKFEHGCICDLKDVKCRIKFDAWWASVDVGFQCPIVCNSSRRAASWQLNLHCRIEETGNPGIVCIVWHQVLHYPSELVTSSVGKHLLGKVNIANLNKFTELAVTELTSSTVDEAALAMLM